MALAITLSFDDPRKFPPLLRLSAGVRRPDVRRVMGRGIANALRRHFIKLDRERPNKFGGKRTHFYGQVRRAVQQPELVAGDGIKVAINHVGIAQRYFGGPIVAGADGSGRKWLTLPARAEAYGKRAGEFSDLHFVFFRRDLAALVQNEQSRVGTRERSGGGVFYWLKPRINQEEDKSVLPTDNELQTAALDAGEAHIRTLVAREGGNV